MRLMVIAAERAATMETTIQKVCQRVAQVCAVMRAAKSAPVNANGSAKTECSNLIISRIVRMRLKFIKLRVLCRNRWEPVHSSLVGHSRRSQQTAGRRKPDRLECRPTRCLCEPGRGTRK